MSVTEQRYKAVLEVIADGRTVSEVASQWEVSARTMHRWLARYEGEGLQGHWVVRPCLGRRVAHWPHQDSGRAPRTDLGQYDGDRR